MHFSDDSPLVLLLHHLANHGDSLLSAGGHSRLIELGENLDFVSNFTHMSNMDDKIFSLFEQIWVSKLHLPQV